MDLVVRTLEADDLGHRGELDRPETAGPETSPPALVLEDPALHVDVVVVGAGLSGIGAARTLQARCPWATFLVLEARHAIGGTWDLFRYPGVRSDSDMFTLGYSFKPWAADQVIADGASIRRYIEETAQETGVVDHVRFGHQVRSIDWSSEEARWTVTARALDTAQDVTVSCQFVFSCTGYYRYDRGYLPEFPGMERFGGTVVHPQAWPEDLDCTGKRVAVIGSGATAVTLVPSLARRAAHVVMVQRSPTYITSLPTRDPVASAIRRLLPDRVSGPILRWSRALMTQGSYQLSRRHPGLVKRLLRRQLERQLPEGYDIDTHFTPRYGPWDQRLCVVPDGDLFRAIRQGTASVVTDQIETFTETGLRLSSGQEIDADVIVTATGLDLLFLGGMVVRVDGELVDPATKLAYKGMMLQDVPNFAFAIGYTNASWTLKCDLTCDHVCRILERLRTSGLRQCTPRADGAEVSPVAMLGLSSGYITRAADRLPRQGTAMPWQVHQSYLHDYRALKLGSIDDPALRFTNPVRRRVSATASWPSTAHR